jgi:transcription-repair coupling factor (superfamily II helicase)
MYFFTMPINNFSQKWQEHPLPAITQWLEQHPETARFTGLCGSSNALAIAELFIKTKKTLLVFVENGKRAEVLAQECKTLAGEDNVSLFPSRDAVPYNMKSPFGPVVESRLNVLSQLLNGEKRIYIAVEATIIQKIISPRDLFNRIIRLTIGNEIPIEKLSGWLVENGFRREVMVQDIGTFCVRGGIVDIYPFLCDGPVRIEFFGDCIDSIREFDVFTQKSKVTRQSVAIFPMKEFCILPQTIDDGLAKMCEFSRDFNDGPETINKLSHQWKTASDYEGIEWFCNWFLPPESSILDYIPADTLLVWDDLLPPQRRINECIHNYERHLERVPDIFKPFVSQPDRMLIPYESIAGILPMFSMVYIETTDIADTLQTYRFSFSEQPVFPHTLEPLIADLTAHFKDGNEIMLVCSNIGHAERLSEMLAEPCPFLTIYIGYLCRGFIDKENKRLIYADSQILGSESIKKTSHKKFSSGQSIPGYDALSPGDYVVHIDHGIGAFIGIEHVASSGDAGRDCMVIQYQDNAKLYVPVEDFFKVQKYIGKESDAPGLSKLGSAAWDKLKKKTRESLKDMAQELIDLYAQRQHAEGIRFAPDALWQKEFEDSFVYEETQDQLRAIKEVKQDMESGRPMDRLICGDVGFGKTEVAMRAAFKAVMDGYQVAILAPTTILAAQHFTTLSERMSDFPVTIGMLSRFLKPKEQKEVCAKLAAGTINILVGTHRILSKDIVFKNLGLLIVDEEQRFGVSHKERLKHYRTNIDVVSMTATPIPRTLHMSLVGARDMSIINTPPRNRLPVETYVREYRDELLGEAIENELERGGQVFVVHNRIQGLQITKDRIEQMVPRARVICAHGQMHENELSVIMKEFIAGRYDVLVSTVIIENGLDIPNVNTIIVIRADTMGLSQLYQLRGRVGRSSEQAYAYFLTPPQREAQELALRRLHALEQYTDLGSGFQIAMRDLEIRGAGNILGTLQHGFIAAVGFDMYCRLLEDAVKEARGDITAAEEPAVTLDISVAAFIPTDYQSDPSIRVEIYQKLSATTKLDDITEIENELLDRFGPMPVPVQSLLLLMRIKVLAKHLGSSNVSISTDGILSLTFDGPMTSMQKTIQHILDHAGQSFEITNTVPILLKTRLSGKSVREQMLEVKNILQSVS